VNTTDDAHPIHIHLIDLVNALAEAAVPSGDASSRSVSLV
jgi:hypothetical protein